MLIHLGSALRFIIGWYMHFNCIIAKVKYACPWLLILTILDGIFQNPNNTVYIAAINENFHNKLILTYQSMSLMSLFLIKSFNVGIIFKVLQLL